ncbi:MAG: hypothetical protein NTY19_06880 [Planctomycetota bacterium]|nr:hypothetical protein [Planctomycetota bacterium]
MLRSLLWLVGVAVAILALVLGPAVFSHLRAVREVAREGIEGALPEVEQAARIRILLQDMDGKILDYQDKLGEVADRTAAEQTAVQRIQQDVNADKQILKQAKDLLEQSRDQYQIGGKSYLKEQLCADVLARVRRCERLEKELQTRRQLAEKLAATEAEGQANLQKAKDVKREKVAELQSLEARLRNAGLLAQVNELTSKLHESPLSPGTELGRAFADFDKRVRKEERRADYFAAETSGGLVVNWNGSAADNTAEAKQALERLLANTN